MNQGPDSQIRTSGGAGLWPRSPHKPREGASPSGPGPAGLILHWSPRTARKLAPGQVLTSHPFRSLGDPRCIVCAMDAEGSTLETWTFVGPTSTYPMCFWCLELWAARGALLVDTSTPESTESH